MKNKKGISTVVETVLILLITIVAVGLIAAFLIPFIRNQLSGTGCFDLIDNVNIDDTSYACFTINRVNLTIEVKDTEIKEMSVAIYSSNLGSSEVYNLKAGTVARVLMKDGSSTIVLPEQRGKKTYSFTPGYSSGDIVKASVAPVLDGKICQTSREVTLKSC